MLKLYSSERIQMRKSENFKVNKYNPFEFYSKIKYSFNEIMQIQKSGV